MQGFFSVPENENRKPLPLIAQCNKCGIYRKCESPKMPVDGEGKKKILIIGSNPEEEDDKKGKPFTDNYGQILESNLYKAGIDLREDCWITNSLICRPTKLEKGRIHNRTPTSREVGYCRPNVVRAIKELKPEIIIPLGAHAVESLMGWLWKETIGPIGRWVGWRIPCREINTWICPTWHPSYILRDAGGKEDALLTKLFLEHLRAAVELKGRPYKEVPDPRKRITIILDPDEASSILFDWRKEIIAFDFETDRLKPDSNDAQIVCCSVSNGTRSIAYPWVDRCIPATQGLLVNDSPKIGWNIKYEQRWTKKLFGRSVNNWKWDGMLAAHILDNRSQITGLKFQSFVRLGVGPYDSAIQPYLKGTGGNGSNRIHQFDLSKTLEYCALDSLFTFDIAKLQMKEMGVDLKEL